MHKVGIIGTGFCGSACSAGLSCFLQDGIDIREYDKFKDTESLESVVRQSDVLFICLPTPMRDDGSCDTLIVESVVKEIVQVASKPKAIVIKSTVLPGTTQKLQDRYPKHTFVFSPEFLTEKRSFEDFLEQDRIILGFTSNRQQFFRVERLFCDFTEKQLKPKEGALIVRVPSEQAELLKYVTNCFLATKLSFLNEIYQICEAIKVDYSSLTDLLKLDVRIGNSHMKVPNDGDFGFGGACLSKDLNALISFAKENNVDPLVLETVWTKNIVVRKTYDWEKLAQVTGKYVKK